MLRNFVKKLPLVRWLYWLRVAKREWLLSEQQLKSAVAQIELRNWRTLEGNYNSIEKGDISPENEQVIVSLTSFGERVAMVHHTILSLMCQTVQPKAVYLWLAEDEFNADNIPPELKRLQLLGLRVEFCPDLKSYKKLIPTLKIHPSDAIITFDDDVIYPQDHIERLVAESKRFPDTVICHLAHQVTFDNVQNKTSDQPRTLLPYRKWPSGISKAKPAKDVYPVGVGGVLYPANCFDEEVFDIDKFMEICPFADDVWFKFMSLKNGRLSKVVDAPTPYREYLHIPKSQETSLWKINRDKNDMQIRALLKAYPEIPLSM